MWDAPTILTLEIHFLAFVALHPAKEKISHPSQLHSSLRQSRLQGVHDGSKQILQDHEAGLFSLLDHVVCMVFSSMPPKLLISPDPSLDLSYAKKAHIITR